MTALVARLAAACLAALAAGCAGEPKGYTEEDIKARCIVTGGVWHPGTAREGFCEYPAPGMV